MTGRFALVCGLCAAGCTIGRSWLVDDCGDDSCCGNGRIDAQETCDDGNRVRWDGCASTCDVEGATECRDEPSVCACNLTHSPDGYQILRATRPIVVDGVLNDWGGAGIIEFGILGVCSHASVRLLWDAETLYVGAEVRDAYLNSSYVDRDSPLYEDDSIELFFDTQGNGGSSSDSGDFKIILSTLNTQTDFRFGGVGNDWEPTWSSVVQATGTNHHNDDVDAGYALELAITWAEWGIATPEAGAAWGLDIKLNDELTPDASGWAAWSNSTLGPPNDPEGWGQAVLSADHAGN